MFPHIVTHTLHNQKHGSCNKAVDISQQLLTISRYQDAFAWPRMQSMPTVPPRFFIEKNCAPTFLFADSTCPKALIFIVFNTYFITFAPCSALGNCFAHLHLRFVPSSHPTSLPKLPYSEVWCMAYNSLWTSCKLTVETCYPQACCTVFNQVVTSLQTTSVILTGLLQLDEIDKFVAVC